ncbi:MAG: amino acid adenylation domain-containing protein [Akkermansiaceae bacterium]
MSIPPSITENAYEFPVSASQRGLWLLEKLDGPNSTYNIPMSLRIKGSLDLAQLRAAFDEIAHRHESLRTAITENDGSPQQTILDRIDVHFETHGQISEENLESALIDEAQKPFALDACPLWRVHLWKLTANQHALQINLHHTIADGYSLMVLWKDLTDCYNARLQNRAPDWSELPIQFADYAAWEESQFKVLEDRAIQYWRHKLADLPELHVPHALPRPPVFSYKGRMQTTLLPWETTQEIESAVARSGLSPFQAYHALVRIALSRWTGQADIPLGIPIANRDRPEFRNLIGFLTNTLVSRHHVVPHASFLDYCETLTQSFKDDLDYADIPFELLAREIVGQRDSSRNPLFQVMFAYQQEPETLPSFGATEVSLIPLPLEVAHFDLRIEVVCRPNSRQLHVEFATDLITENSVADLISIFQSTLKEFAQEPTAKITSEADSIIPLSPHQERIWFIDTFETGNVYSSHPVYHNMPVVWQRDDWQLELVQQTLACLSERHEIFRSRVCVRSDVPSLEIQESVAVAIKTISLPDENDISPLLKYAARPIGLSDEALFKVAIGRPKNGKSSLLLVSHQLVVDRRALRILALEFTQIYDALVLNGSLNGSLLNLPQSASLKEIAELEKQRQDDAYTQHLNFWLNELALPLAPLELPYDFPRHPVHLYEMGRYSVPLATALSERLLALSETLNTSIESILLGTFQILLSCYSRQEEIVIGLTQPAESTAIAPLANLMVCREHLKGTTSYAEHIEAVEHHLITMRSSGGVSFDRLVSALNPPKDMSRTALFDVLFEYTTGCDESEGLQEFNIGFGKYDLHAWFSKTPSGIQLELTYNRQLFREETIERMGRHFQTLIQQVSQTPEITLSSISIVEPGKELLQISSWDTISATFPEDATIVQLFESQVQKTPDHIAIRDGEVSISYLELNQRSNLLAAQLLAHTAQPDALVGICLGKSTACVVAMLAVLKAGAAYLPLDPSIPQKRLQWILEDSAVRLVIGDEESLCNIEVPVKLDYDSLDYESETSDNPKKAITPSQVAYCIYTSGSTGKPKGVLVEHQQVVRLLINDQSPFDFSASDTWTFFHSPGFDFSVWEIYGALLFGGSLVVVPSCVAEDSQQFADFLVNEKVTILNQTPTSFYYLANELRETPRKHQLRMVIFGGETLHPLRLKGFHQTYPDVSLVNMYGITETTVHVTYKHLLGEDFDSHRNLIGRPLPTTTTLVLDSHGNVLPAGIPGELYVGGKGVSRGYLNRPELTEERFVPDPFVAGERLYRTGDLGVAMENGELVHLGRIDSQIQIRGFRIEIGEIEARLLEHPKIREATVVPQVVGSETSQMLVAYIVPSTTESLGLLPASVQSELQAALSEWLPHYMIPSRFIAIEQIHLTPNGKADLSRLPDLNHIIESDGTDQIEISENLDQPLASDDPVLEKITSIWQTLLASEELSQHSDFFSLGGYSLLATRMLALVEKDIGVKAPLRTLFDHPTLGDFSMQLKEALSKEASETHYDSSATITDETELSSTQKRLWFLNRLNRDSAAYHLFGSVELDGSIDVQRLQNALNQVTRKHSALRTSFLDRDGEPYTSVLAQVEVPINIEDLNSLSQSDQIKSFKEHSQAFSRIPFHLEQAPLIRAKLYRFSGGFSKLVIGLHHIIADGWSLNLLVRDLLAAYWGSAFNPKQPATCRPVKVFSANEREKLSTFWQAQLANQENLQLPTDFVRPPTMTEAGAQLEFSLDAKVVKKLKLYCQNSRYTPFMVCIAAFALLLSRKARQSGFAVGVPLANRDDADSHETIGCFVNTMPFVFCLNEELTFEQLLETTCQTTLDLHQNQQLPFDQLVDVINPERDMSVHPLYQVIFNYQESLFRDEDSQSILPKVSPIDMGAAQVDLALYLEEQSDTLQALLVYRTDLFTHESMEVWSTYFQYLLGHCLEQPDLPLNRQQLLTAKEQSRRNEWNCGTTTVWSEPLLLHQLVESSAQRVPNKTALVLGKQSWTYRELDAHANALAARLVQKHDTPDSWIIAICFERSIEMVVSMLAILKAGGAYLPIDVAQPTKRIQSILETAQVSLILSSEASAKITGDQGSSGIECWVYSTAAIAPDVETISANRSPSDPAYVIFTSGSTGTPKGVVNTHAGIRNRLLWMRDYLAMDEKTDRVLQKTPYTFDVSLWDIFLPLVSGVELVLAQPEGHKDPSWIISEIKRLGITTLHFVPSMLQAFLLHPDVPSCTTLKHVICSGEALTKALAESIHTLLPSVRLHNLYGPTEAAVDVSSWECVPNDASDPIPIGKPIANMGMRILDTFLRDVPSNDYGEICIEGVGLADGYCQNPELTTEVFVTDPHSGTRVYKTGDLGRFRSDGVIEYHRRLDNQVKLRGLRIELGEVDTALLAIPGILEAATVVSQGKDQLVSYVVVAQQSSTPPLSEIKTVLKRSLPEYMVPSQILTLEHLPLTTSGKTNRKHLIQLKPPSLVEVSKGENQNLDQSSEPWQGPWEKLVAEIWCELLEVDEIGRRDNFFDVGGHSLLLIKTHLMLQQQIEISFDLVELFSYPTIESLATFLASLAKPDTLTQDQPATTSPRKTETEIAIVGMSGRFPGAKNLEAFGEMVLQSVPAITFYQQEELLTAGADANVINDSAFVPAFGAVDDIDLFDADYFGFSPAEAKRLDPQMRLFLMCAEEALQHSGIVPEQTSLNVGVFAGASVSTYGLLQMTSDSAQADPDVFATMLANDKDYLATRVAYKLGLQGPAFTIQTACSTSLSAVHVACQSILNGECDMALAGGVSLQSGMPPGYHYQKDGILSPDGHCRAFAADAAGTVQGSGCGVVMLKPLNQALADGDPVLAVISGSAMNNDGNDKIGFTAPSVKGQQKVIQSALAKAGIGAETVSYIEAHGTGTALGDMIEVSALKSVFANSPNASCVLGSVKAQIGHLDAAAGVTGLIKTVCCLQNQTLPPTLYGENPNAALGLEDSPFVLNTKARPWLSTAEGSRIRTAGVSSFGIGGTNVHLIVRENDLSREAEVSSFHRTNPVAQTSKQDDRALIVLSAPSVASLKVRQQWLAETIESQPPLDLTALAWTLQTGRKHYSVRTAYLVNDLEDLRTQLQGALPKSSPKSSPKVLFNATSTIDELETLRDTWMQGVELDWNSYQTEDIRRIALPPFPFVLQRYWALDSLKTKKIENQVSPHVQIYQASLRPLSLKALKNQASNLTRSLFIGHANQLTQAHECLKNFPQVRAVETSTFLGDSHSLVEETPCLIYALDIQSSAISDAELIVEVKNLVTVASRARAQRLLILMTGHASLEPNVRENVIESLVIVLRQEIPTLKIRLLQTGAINASALQTAQNILCTDSIPHPIVKQLDHSLLVRHLGLIDKGSTIERTSHSKLQQHGHYLITGAGGGIAKHLALYLAEHYQAHLYLCSRRAVSPTLLRELSKTAATVTTFTLDIVDNIAVQKMMARFTSLDGTFHLAGISGEAAILSTRDLEASKVQKILAPKSIGSSNLLESLVTRDSSKSTTDDALVNRGFFVAFSSISTQLGGFGFGAYAAANAAMDALVEQYRQTHALDAYSIGWDGWQTSDETLPNALTPHQGIEALETILNNQENGQYFVAVSPLAERIKNWVCFEQIAEINSSNDLLQDAHADTSTNVQQILTEIWSDLLGVSDIGSEDNFAELGGDSLLALQMLTLISKRFPVELGISDIMQTDTLGDLSKLIESDSPTVPETISATADEPPHTAELSLVQQRIWFHEKILETKEAYQIPVAFRITGPLDTHLLERAFQQLIAAYDVLRFSITEDNGQPMALYANSVTWSLPIVDDATKPENINSLLSALVSEPFDMTQAPLIKSRLVQLGNQDYVLALCLHHIIVDGWSVAVFIDELCDIYERLCSGSSAMAVSEAPSYQDYLESRTEDLRKRKGRLEAFWKNYLNEAPLQFDFPSDRNRPPIENSTGTEIGIPIDASLMAQLNDLAKANKTTLFTLLYATFCTLLHRLTGTEDLLIGTPHSGRRDHKLNRSMGLFMDTLPLRCQPQSDLSFQHFLNHCRDQVFRAFDHAEAPFDWIVNAVNPPRDLSRSPVYQVMFSFLNQPKGTPTFTGCQTSLLASPSVGSKVDLSLAVEERSGAYSVSIEYKTDLYDESRIRSLLKYYVQLLTSISKQPSSRLCELKLMPIDEQTRVFQEWNDTQVFIEPSLTLASLLQQSRADDNQFAYKFRSEGITYGELKVHAQQLAMSLVSRAIQSNDIIAVMLDRGLQYPVAIHGIMQAGAAFLPLSTDSPSERLHYILENSEAKLLIVSSSSKLVQADFNIPLATIEDLVSRNQLDDTERIGSTEEPLELPQVNQENLAYCMYTSGTTGKPKGVEIRHLSAVNLLQALTCEPGVPKGSSFLGLVPFSFDVSVGDLFIPLFVGGTCVILDEVESKDPQQFNAIVASHENPILQATASTLRMLLQQGWDVPHNLRVWCGGEQFPPDLARQLLGKGKQIYNVYGPTETTVWSAVHPVTRAESIVSIGRPIQNTRMYILDKGHTPLPPGYTGELFIAGEGLAQGYRRQLNLTKERFIIVNISGVGVERLYGTGDLARWRQDGTLEVLGRIDAQLKILGHRIEPGEIESILTDFSEIEEAAVTSTRDRLGETQLAAYVVCDPSVNLDSIRKQLRDKLPLYMVPRWLFSIPAIPRSSNGKIDRNALPKVEPTPQNPNTALSNSDEYLTVEPGTDPKIVKQVRQIWCQTLECEIVGTEQNFFELGGHSLLAVHLLAEIKKALGTLVPIVTFLQNPTISGICQSLWSVNESAPILIELSPSDQKTAKQQQSVPVILIPGASGNPHSYRALAPPLSPSCNLYGMAPPEIDGSSIPTMEALAAEYICVLKNTFSPPYHLIGHSFGAALAFEITKQLSETGIEVHNLIMIDLPSPEHLKQHSAITDAELLHEITDAAREFAGLPLTIGRESADSHENGIHIKDLSIDDAKTNLLNILEQAGMLPPQSDGTLADLVLTRYRTSLTILDNFQPTPISVPITVVRSNESESTSGLPKYLGWETYTTGSVQVILTSGSHISMITEPHVTSLAKAIKPLFA